MMFCIREKNRTVPRVCLQELAELNILLQGQNSHTHLGRHGGLDFTSTAPGLAPC